MSIAKQPKLINKYKVAKTVLNENSKTFVIYIAALKALKLTKIIIYFSQFTQVLLKTQLAIF